MTDMQRLMAIVAAMDVPASVTKTRSGWIAQFGGRTYSANNKGEIVRIAEKEENNEKN